MNQKRRWIPLFGLFLAALTMYENGFEKVYALLGGLEEWVNAGFPVEEYDG